MKDPLGVSPSKGNQGTTRGKEKFLLTSVGIEVNCVYSATRHNIDIQLFRQRLSHKSIKAYATMPIGIMGRKILALTD